jgi:hypothetical protein
LYISSKPITTSTSIILSPRKVRSCSFFLWGFSVYRIFSFWTYFSGLDFFTEQCKTRSFTSFCFPVSFLLSLVASNNSSDSLHQQYVSCHRCFVILGDLARYHRDLIQDPAQKNWVQVSPPFAFSLLSLLLDPFAPTSVSSIPPSHLVDA